MPLFDKSKTLTKEKMVSNRNQSIKKSLLKYADEILLDMVVNKKTRLPVTPSTSARAKLVKGGKIYTNEKNESKIFLDLLPVNSNTGGYSLRNTVCDDSVLVNKFLVYRDMYNTCCTKDMLEYEKNNKIFHIMVDNADIINEHRRPSSKSGLPQSAKLAKKMSQKYLFLDKDAQIQGGDYNRSGSSSYGALEIGDNDL
ncbi:MAG: hypothetical protein EP298_05380 [Gammaproteobacteria bacterium]|nr:MAG: hypothetical protein EP298_05380 [Gammaproteobacteria bacterium]UTW43252.1 hypothetical protein KFE69_03665 [bacterium SCSIO 12844]